LPTIFWLLNVKISHLQQKSRKPYKFSEVEVATTSKNKEMNEYFSQYKHEIKQWAKETGTKLYHVRELTEHEREQYQTEKIIKKPEFEPEIYSEILGIKRTLSELIEYNDIL